MLLSPSSSPAPAHSPPATSSPPAPPLSPLPPPLSSPPPLPSPPDVLPPAASTPPTPENSPPPSPVISQPPTPVNSPPPSPVNIPPPSSVNSPPPSPLDFPPPSPVISPPPTPVITPPIPPVEYPPSPTALVPSVSPPLPFLPAKPSPPETVSPGKTISSPPPSLPSDSTPPVNTPPPPPSPHRRRGPKSTFPPPINSSPPPKPSPNTPSLPETSSPPKPPLSTTPLSTPPPKNSPATNLPFFGPVSPLPNKPTVSPPPIGPGESLSPGKPQPLLPKSLPETTSYHRSSAGFLLGGGIVGALLLVLLGLLFVFYRATRNRSQRSSHHHHHNHQSPKLSNVQHHPNQSNVVTMPPPKLVSTIGYGTKEHGYAPMNVTKPSGMFSYNELVEATSGFSESNLLGEGGFGYVHKGVLKNGREVAVKQLKIGSCQGEREFQAEVDTISRVHHKHLVSLVGYCINGDKRLLVYEFVPKDTLEFHLHGNEGIVLEWEMRLRIAVGAAKGLAYLHEDCSPTIIHRDIKAANILLDSKYEAKVSDFGLAKFFSDTNSSVTHISTRVVGTFGYMAPEYASSGKVTDKSDVYSFGVVLLELITGRTPIFAKDSTTNQSLVDWARPLLAKVISGERFDHLVDLRLEKTYDTTQMANMAACAAACIRQSAWLRPRMSQVIRALEGEVALRKVEEMGNSRTNSSSENPNDIALQYGTSKRRFDTDLSDGYTSEYGINPSQSSNERQQ
ncbi:unnamed protein product [Cochlearia groenlandica]